MYGNTNTTSEIQLYVLQRGGGNGCKCGDLFPVLLAMSGEHICPNFEYDPTKEERRKQLNKNEL